MLIMGVQLFTFLGGIPRGTAVAYSVAQAVAHVVCKYTAGYNTLCSMPFHEAASLAPAVVSIPHDAKPLARHAGITA